MAQNRDREWRRWRQTIIVIRRLKFGCNRNRYYHGYKGDYEYEDSFVPRWHDYLGSNFEFRFRTSWSDEYNRLEKEWDNGDSPFKKYYRPKVNQYNKRYIRDEIKEFYTELDQ